MIGAQVHDGCSWPDVRLPYGTADVSADGEVGSFGSCVAAAE